MSEVVEEHPSLIPVINRFGIRLGLGDKSVKAICEEYRLDTDFLLTVINTFLNEEYFPEKKLQTFHTSQIIDYLTKTNQYYQRYQIPNIERHLGSFISMSTPGNNTLNLIGKFFSSFKEELTSRIEKDDRVWFPYCLSLSEKLKDYPSSGLYSSNKVLVFNLGFDRKGNEKRNHWLYFPEKKYIFYRVGFYDNIFNSDRLSAYVEIGFRQDAQIDINACLTRVLKDLETAGIISGQKLVSSHSVIMDRMCSKMFRTPRALPKVSGSPFSSVM